MVSRKKYHNVAVMVSEMESYYLATINGFNLNRFLFPSYWQS